MSVILPPHCEVQKDGARLKGMWDERTPPNGLRFGFVPAITAHPTRCHPPCLAV
jgi:hypothetical protein